MAMIANLNKKAKIEFLHVIKVMYKFIQVQTIVLGFQLT
jgi:hypothetical protein